MHHFRTPARALRPTLIALAALAATTAWAQQAPVGPRTADPAAEQQGPLDTIVITARKRAEASQAVPISVSAFNADSLERSKIVGAQDLQFSIPNAVLTGNDRFTIRGIGNNSLGGDNGVGLAVNGASIGFLPQDEFFDLERIEVLRGPQGTLFGRNTTGGALAVFTKRPTAKQEGSFYTELGNYDHLRAGGVFNFVVNENLRQRFAGYVLQQGGFTKNEFTGNGIDGRNQFSLRSSTRLFIGDATEVNLMISAYSEDSSRTRETKRQCKAIPVLGCSPNELGFDSPNFSATLFSSLTGPLSGAFFGAYVPAGSNIYTGALNPQDLRAVAADYDAKFQLSGKSATLELTHEFDPVTLTWISGWSKSNTDQRTDWDNSALAFRFTRPLTYRLSADEVITTDQLRTTDSFTANSSTFTNELRVASRGKGPFSYTTGLFQYESKGGSGFFIYHPYFELLQKAQGRPPETWFVNTESRNNKTKAWAWFGEGQYKFSEDLRGTLGARYTKEDRTGEGRSIILSPSVPFATRTPISDSHTTGRASLDYTPAKDTLLYGSLATGYKGGGFNTGSLTKPTFEPETVRAIEVGAKREWFNGTLRTNVAAFHNDYKNMQLAQRIAGAAITANADATTKGLEFETQYAPARAWLLDANVSFLRTSIGNFLTEDAANPAQSLTATTPVVQVNLAGNKLPHSPETKIKVGAQYTMGLFGSGWNSTWRIDHVWQDKYFAREFNTPTDRIGAWSVTNLQLRIASPKNDLEFKAFVKNLADNDNVTNIIIEDPLVGRYRNVRLLDPRTFGVQVQYNF
jgi:outer membrane receptor protein involved in Fe transport